MNLLSLTAGIRILFLFCMCCAFSSCTTSNIGTSSTPPKIIRVGALLPLTGDLALSGGSELQALDIAVEDVNAFLISKNAGFRIELIKEDSGTNPEKALEGLQTLTDQGVRLVIGPDSSENIFRTLPWANWFNVILISPASTAPTLSIPDDNLFRMTPDDTHQAKSITQKMWEDGKRIIIPVFRDDQYANDLVTAVKVNLTMLGGTMLRGIRYDPDATNFKKITTRLKQEVQKASLQYGTSSLAIYIVSFEEATTLFRAARKSPTLKAVKWYGNESLALNHDLISDASVSKFVIGRQFTCPQYYAASKDSGAVRSRIEQTIGFPVETYTFAAYDALWLAAKAYLAAGPSAGVATLKAILPEVAESYSGLTGSTEFNASGDRKSGSYHLWQTKKEKGNPAWINISSSGK